MKWTNRTMGAACFLGLIASSWAAIPALGLCALAVWKTRGGERDW